MRKHKFQPGFRLSAIDVIVLILGGAASAFAGGYDRWLGIGIAFVVSHFFLFCNVLRMSRPLELVWAGIFATLASVAISTGWIPWSMVFALSGAATLAVAIVETRRPSYHGVGWQNLNPRLPQWWESNSV